MQNDISAQLLKTVSHFRKPEVLYRYTSAAGLIGTLNSQSIWATTRQSISREILEWQQQDDLCKLKGGRSDFLQLVAQGR